ncbi:MAG: TonB-dependent receptor [Breznakibacter sp.]
MGQAGFGFKNSKLNTWYRLDWLDESIMGLGDVNVNTNTATDKDYNTTRLTHQLQGSYLLNNKWSFNACASYQDYERATQTTTINLTTNDRRLSLDAGAQDVSKFENLFVRATSVYKQNSWASYQFGLEAKNDHASGDRIQGEPTISDYSAFASAEIKIGESIQLRPGLRFSKNSTYDAPPVIPSFNTKIKLGEWTDLRLSYARGFRAPALRELYFWFFDASHSIKGNTDLKAEYSNSYTATFTWRPIHSEKARLTTSLSPFYNQFNDLITTATDANDPSVYTYVNIDEFKTTGATMDVAFRTGNWQLNAGFSYIARYNKYSQMDEYEDQNTDQFEWSPEATFSALYQLPKWKTSLSLTYKFTGEKPSHELVTANGTTTVHKTYIGEFHWADFTVVQPVVKYLKLQAGVRNIFDITNLDNTSQASGGHSTSGPLPLSYGRSYLVGLIFEL